MCIIGGQVQTGSVFLQATPEDYRCMNEMDIKFGENFDAHGFGSTETKCKQWDVAWDECPSSDTLEDYEACFDSANPTTCSTCDEYVYSPNNTFTQTVVTQFHWLCDTSPIPVSTISTSIFMTGLFFGALGLGNLSDAIGRRRTMLLSATVFHKFECFV